MSRRRIFSETENWLTAWVPLGPKHSIPRWVVVLLFLTIVLIVLMTILHAMSLRKEHNQFDDDCLTKGLRLEHSDNDHISYCFDGKRLVGKWKR